MAIPLGIALGLWYTIAPPSTMLAPPPQLPSLPRVPHVPWLVTALHGASMGALPYGSCQRGPWGCGVGKGPLSPSLQFLPEVSTKFLYSNCCLHYVRWQPGLPLPPSPLFLAWFLWTRWLHCVALAGMNILLRWFSCILCQFWVRGCETTLVQTRQVFGVFWLQGGVCMLTPLLLKSIPKPYLQPLVMVHSAFACRMGPPIPLAVCTWPVCSSPQKNGSSEEICYTYYLKCLIFYNTWEILDTSEKPLFGPRFWSIYTQLHFLGVLLVAIWWSNLEKPKRPP